MASSSAAARASRRTARSPILPLPIVGEENLEKRVRSLLDAAAYDPANTSAPAGVLLDLSVNGFRCTVRKLPPPEDAAIGMLSPREQEIARMVARGYPNKMIAAVLEISVWTVGTYLRRIFAKLSVASRAAMVARLSRDGNEA